MNRVNVVLVLALIAIFLGGCAMIKEAKEDYKVGTEAPITEGEVSPAEQAQRIVAMISGVPYIGPYAGTVGTVLTGFLAWRRGRKIRQGLPLNIAPSTGFLGKVTGVETVIQTASNVLSGAFEVGADNSPLKRAWKVGLATVLGLVTLALAYTPARDFFMTHPEIFAGISGLSGLFGGVEKALSNVQPVAPKPS